MKFADAMIAYHPGGPIRVGPWPDRRGWSNGYPLTVGCWEGCPDGNQLLALILLDFHHAVVRDGVPVQEAHAAFLQIDEYRDAMAEDVPR